MDIPSISRNAIVRGLMPLIADLRAPWTEDASRLAGLKPQTAQNIVLDKISFTNLRFEFSIPRHRPHLLPDRRFVCGRAMQQLLDIFKVLDTIVATCWMIF